MAIALLQAKECPTCLISLIAKFVDFLGQLDKAGPDLVGALNEITRAMEFDLKWIDATIELYQYTNENQTHISGRGASRLEFDRSAAKAVTPLIRKERE